MRRAAFPDQSLAEPRSLIVPLLLLLTCGSCCQAPPSSPEDPASTTTATAPSDNDPAMADPDEPSAWAGADSEVPPVPPVGENPGPKASPEGRLAAGGGASDGGASDPKPTSQQSSTATPPPVDANPLGGCDMCHVDVVDQFAGTLHHTEKVDCVECHGRSDGHVNDENNEVLPDRVFARADVDSFCKTCHECSKVVRQTDAGTPAEKKICTDCHGAHDLRLAAETASRKAHAGGHGQTAAASDDGA